MASFKNPLRGSGSGGGLGSALFTIRCYISLGKSYPALCRILKVSIEETISLCFSKRPLLVKWKETIEIVSTNSFTLILSSSGDKA